MCGITGIITFDASKVNLASLKSMNESVMHRGPDGGGYWVHDDGFIGFAHRRLSILDLSAFGSQPMSYSDGRYMITFNGEIFNFIEIRKNLQNLGYRFNSDTDTEVIIASYDYWGKDCLKQFNGMWAFAIWDQKERELFLARDHFGIKPLYYFHDPGKRLVFGSETNQFNKLDSFKKEVDRDRLIDCLFDPDFQEGYGLTIFKEIVSVLPGCWVSVKHGELQIVRWWDTLNFPIEVPENYEDQVSTFKDLFFDSLQLRLRSDVPIATALSGGVDSSSVYSSLHYLSKNHLLSGGRAAKEWQQAFVACFPDTSKDETLYAKQVIDSYSGEAEFWYQDKNNLVNDIISYTQRFDAVYSTPIHVVSKIYGRMRENGIVVSMDGHGVDEMMYGYPGLQIQAASQALERHDILFVEDLIDTYINLYPQTMHSRLKDVVHKIVYKKEFQSPWFNSLKDKSRNLALQILNQTKIKEQWLPIHEINRSTISTMSTSDSRYEWRSENSLFDQFHVTRLPAILRNFDKASMMSGVEIRMPFMDHRLVSFIFKLPLKSKINGGFTKRILRDAMKGILTDSVRGRTGKIGLSAPWNEWVESDLKEFILDTVGSDSFLKSDYWNGRRIQKDMYKYYNDNKQINLDKLWLIINAHIILQHNSR
jgi:asparagine synthase (glutamine-hydrolysing)